jgi:hypothetical protein
MRRLHFRFIAPAWGSGRHPLMARLTDTELGGGLPRGDRVQRTGGAFDGGAGKAGDP